MKLDTEKNGRKLVIRIEGELNAITAPELKDVVEGAIDDVDEIVFDLSGMGYTSSAGLRVFLMAQQIMDDKGGKITVIGVNETVMDIFNETGFVTFLDISTAE